MLSHVVINTIGLEWQVSGMGLSGQAPEAQSLASEQGRAVQTDEEAAGWLMVILFKEVYS
jgi:hypothetical protein